MPSEHYSRKRPFAARRRARAALLDALETLFASRSWKLVRPLLNVLLGARTLGTGPTILDDIRALMAQDRRLACSPDSEGYRMAVADRIAAYRWRAVRQGDVGTAARTIAIKVPVPDWSVRNEWGDYHFAVALGGALERRGYSVRIDLRPDWYARSDDDVALVLRGLRDYRPRDGELGLMWLISHPKLVKNEEIDRFDHVFVASTSYADTLRRRSVAPVEPLLQCTDTERFKPVPGVDRNDRVLFVGNSRGEFRPIVREAVNAGLDLDVYGTHWNAFIDPAFIAGEHLDNALVRQAYARAGVVLNDHWEDMRREGFISNRIFDALAVGAIVISDDVDGLESLFGDHVVVHRPGVDDLSRQVRDAMDAAPEREAQRLEMAEEISREHDFAARAAVIDRVISGYFEVMGDPDALDGPTASRAGRPDPAVSSIDP